VAADGLSALVDSHIGQPKSFAAAATWSSTRTPVPLAYHGFHDPVCCARRDSAPCDPREPSLSQPFHLRVLTALKVHRQRPSMRAEVPAADLLPHSAPVYASDHLRRLLSVDQRQAVDSPGFAAMGLLQNRC